MARKMTLTGGADAPPPKPPELTKAAFLEFMASVGASAQQLAEMQMEYAGLWKKGQDIHQIDNVAAKIVHRLSKMDSAKAEMVFRDIVRYANWKGIGKQGHLFDKQSDHPEAIAQARNAGATAARDPKLTREDHNYGTPALIDAFQLAFDEIRAQLERGPAETDPPGGAPANDFEQGGDAYEAKGFEAFGQGVARAECPYLTDKANPQPLDAISVVRWQMGWDRAEEEKAAQARGGDGKVKRAQGRGANGAKRRGVDVFPDQQ